jgi:putative membrane-bound dehydrogenase-like protein
MLRMPTLLLAPLVVCALPGAARAQAMSSDLSASFSVPAGCAVSLWAESPLFYNPTAIDIDPQGRVWITEAVNYRQWDGRNPGLHHDAGDRVVVVEDRDGDGVAETSTVFAQDSDLVSPLGICWLPDKVLVSCSPTVWAYYDDDGDLKADRKEVFLTGFGGPNHDHGAHSFSVGPDGRLYMALGNAGPHIVTDKSGWTLRSGSVYDGGGQFVAPNKPGLVSDDGRVYVGGLVLRCNQDATGLAVLAHNFRNPYEVAVDAFGDMWTFDNDDDGNECCRATWVMEGGNYGYFSADGSRYWQADWRPGQSVQKAHWHQDDPGVVPTTLITGSGGPTGVCIYEGDALPEPLHGALLCADAGRSAVFALRRVPDGAGFKLLPQDAAAGAPLVTGAPEGSEPLTALLVSKPAKDGDETWHLFRPSDVCVAPDGSVLIADWFDPGVGGHQAQDRKAYGRLLRISASGARTGSMARVPNAESVRELAGALDAPAQSQRAVAWRELERRERSKTSNSDPNQVVGHQLDMLTMEEDAPMSARSRALFATANVARAADWVPDDTRSWPMYDVSEPRELWAARLRALRFCGVAAQELQHRSSEWWSDSVTAREMFIARSGLRRGSDILSLLQVPDVTDRSVLEAARLEWPEPGIELDEATAGIFDQPLEWTAAVAAVAWCLHPDQLVPAFAARVLSPTLDRAAREQSLTALAFCKSREAGEAMLAAALVGPADTRELAAWWVKHHDTNVWRDYSLAQHLRQQARWTDADIIWRSGPVTRGSVPVNVDVTGSKFIALVVTDGDNGNSCDWAAWLAPRISSNALPFASDPLHPDKSLLVSRQGRNVPWVSAAAGWGDVRVGRNCEGGPLSVGGVVHADAIGTHAPSEIVFYVADLPGVTWLRATAAVDDGGTRQGGSPTSVEFIVYADRAAQKELTAAIAAANRSKLQRAVLDRELDLEARVAAAEELAADPQGGALLLAEAAAGHLDELDLHPDVHRELHDAIAEAIFLNPDLGVRALASEYFTRPGAPALPPMAELAALPGDRSAGQALYFGAARCSACHAVRGRGGDVGPDLSAIRSKYGRAELLDSILNPSAAIGAGFESVTLTLSDGRVLAGLLQADGAQVLLKDGVGARHVVDATGITERRASKLSLMPEDISRGLSPQQLADLCAFLQHDPSAPPVLGPAQELWNGRDLAGWVGVPDASAWSVRDADGAPVLHTDGQPIGYVRTEQTFTSFELTVEWRFPDPSHPGNSGVLLRVQPPDQVWPRSLEAQLNSGDAGDIWNIGDFAADLDPARTEGRRTMKLLPSSERPLGEWNTYRITLRDGDLTLEVNGQVQNRARWCEELAGSIALQSEGAPIEFRRVMVREIAE